MRKASRCYLRLSVSGVLVASMQCCSLCAAQQQQLAWQSSCIKGGDDWIECATLSWLDKQKGLSLRAGFRTREAPLREPVWPGQFCIIICKAIQRPLLRVLRDCYVLSPLIATIIRATSSTR